MICVVYSSDFEESTNDFTIYTVQDHHNAYFCYIYFNVACNFKRCYFKWNWMYALSSNIHNKYEIQIALVPQSVEEEKNDLNKMKKKQNHHMHHWKYASQFHF